MNIDLIKKIDYTYHSLSKLQGEVIVLKRENKELIIRNRKSCEDISHLKNYQVELESTIETAIAKIQALEIKTENQTKQIINNRKFSITQSNITQSNIYMIIQDIVNKTLAQNLMNNNNENIAANKLEIWAKRNVETFLCSI